jgi:hypothetical protein
MHHLLTQTVHRSIPMPRGPWIMKQCWHDLLFAHWVVDSEQLRRLVPAELELDLFQGRAYTAVAPFWMSGIRGRLSPPVPGMSTFPELNVRTYVSYCGIPGVYFFSLDAASRLAVWGARRFYALPYFHADMSIQPVGEKKEAQFEYRSRRIDIDGNRPAEFRGRYWPVGDPKQSESGSLAHFLTERYCLYTVQQSSVRRGYIHHLPWSLQEAEAEIEVNTMTSAAGIHLPKEKPILHYSRFIEVLIWWPEQAD